jgi:hypothetical protein
MSTSSNHFFLLRVSSARFASLREPLSRKNLGKNDLLAQPSASRAVKRAFGAYALRFRDHHKKPNHEYE